MGGRVARGGDDLEALQTQVVAGPVREQGEGAPRDAVPASRGAHPVVEPAVGLDGVDAQQVDRADDLAGSGVVDRQVGVAAVAPRRAGLADPGHRVAERVGRRQAAPVADVGLPAGGHQRGGVVDLPRAQHDRPVGQVRQAPGHRGWGAEGSGTGGSISLNTTTERAAARRPRPPPRPRSARRRSRPPPPRPRRRPAPPPDPRRPARAARPRPTSVVSLEGAWIRGA